MKIVVHPKKCRASGECIRICPQDAISIIDGLATMNEKKCDLDGMCIPAFPHEAIGFTEEE